MNKQDVLKTLNEEQKIPVQNYKGPQFLVAGPGSGKTRVLIAKTQYMILDGVNPRNILLFTFTLSIMYFLVSFEDKVDWLHVLCVDLIFINVFASEMFMFAETLLGFGFGYLSGRCNDICTVYRSWTESNHQFYWWKECNDHKSPGNFKG